MQKDPISKMKVDDQKPKFVSELEGMKFYFSSAGCKQKFDADPHKYAH